MCTRPVAARNCKRWRMAEGTLLRAELCMAGRLDARFFALLQALHDTGSINRAARTAGYSYKGAWMVLDSACNMSLAPLFEATRSGTRLTAAAHALLAAWQELQAAHHHFLHEQEAWLLKHHPALAATFRRLSMKTSARNQFAGKITAVEIGPVSAQATLTLPGGQQITAAMTSAAAKKLKLKKGQEAIALVKAPAIVLVTDFAGYALSARNKLAGTVSRVEKGAVSSLVGITLPGGHVVTASVTNDAVSALALKVGQSATAVFKAYSVMLAVMLKPPAP